MCFLFFFSKASGVLLKHTEINQAFNKSVAELGKEARKDRDVCISRNIVEGVITYLPIEKQKDLAAEMIRMTRVLREGTQTEQEWV